MKNTCGAGADLQSRPPMTPSRSLPSRHTLSTREVAHEILRWDHFNSGKMEGIIVKDQSEKKSYIRNNMEAS